jgi:hypothetical protein
MLRINSATEESGEGTTHHPRALRFAQGDTQFISLGILEY